MCALELAMHYMLFYCAGVFAKVNNSMCEYVEKSLFFFILPMDVGYFTVSISSFSYFPFSLFQSLRVMCVCVYEYFVYL